jgi:antitoxin component of RelBE/YafQ-DinJ toxin-antitoxin module
LFREKEKKIHEKRIFFCLAGGYRTGAIPFHITVNAPNAETVAAMLEAERIARDPNVKGYHDVEQMFEESLQI